MGTHKRVNLTQAKYTDSLRKQVMAAKGSIGPNVNSINPTIFESTLWHVEKSAQKLEIRIL